MALAITLAGCTSGTSGSPSPAPTTPTSTPTTSTLSSSTPADSESVSSPALTPSVDSNGPSGSAATKTVDVIITRSGWDATAAQASANAIIPGTVVSGGTCTLTLTMGTASAASSREATATADSTQCGVLTVAGSQLTPGTWTAVVTFSSPTASGTSSPASVTVTG